MPIREGRGRAKLWFKTKEEADEYDDQMISNIELTTSDQKDDNYCLMFVRQKREAFLGTTEKPQNEFDQIERIIDPYTYIIKYQMGKRDHTINRYARLQRGFAAWGIGYLLLRELPIRNFYARSSIMLLTYAMYSERKGTLNPLRPLMILQQDEYTNKDIRNYQAYTDMSRVIIPKANNKISEAKVWELNQPAYMREHPAGKLNEIGSLFIPPKQKIVAWDGTFNMPLEGLAHPLHKDGKHIEFTWWEY